MKPTVGRIVHFYDYTRPRDASGKAGPFAAIVTADHDADHRATLTVFPPGYPPFAVFNVAHEETPEHGGQFWTWPPREGAGS